VPDAAAVAADILARFTKVQDGYRARVGQVQIARWRDQLDQAAADAKAAFTPIGWQGAAQHTYTTACDGNHPPGPCPPHRNMLVAEGNGPLLDPDCRDGKCGSCIGPPCEHECHSDLPPKAVTAAAVTATAEWEHDAAVAAAWLEGYGTGRDDEADNLPLREYQAPVADLIAGDSQ
jgi:hypothetical protein